MLEEYFSVRSNITRIFLMLKLLTSFRPVEFYAELVKTTGDCDFMLRFNPRTRFFQCMFLEIFYFSQIFMVANV